MVVPATRAEPRAAPKTVVECLREAGWLTTSGSTGVYLSMRVLVPGISRDTIDRAALDGVDVMEVPSNSETHSSPPWILRPGARHD